MAIAAAPAAAQLGRVAIENSGQLACATGAIVDTGFGVLARLIQGVVILICVIMLLITVPLIFAEPTRGSGQYIAFLFAVAGLGGVIFWIRSAHETKSCIPPGTGSSYGRQYHGFNASAANYAPRSRFFGNRRFGHGEDDMDEETVVDVVEGSCGCDADKSPAGGEDPVPLKKVTFVEHAST